MEHQALRLHATQAQRLILLRVQVLDDIERVAIGKGDWVTRLLALAHRILDETADEGLAHALAGLLVLDGARHDGMASVARVAETLLSDPSELHVSTPLIPDKQRLALLDHRAPWRYPLVHGLLTYMLPPRSAGDQPWFDHAARLRQVQCVAAHEGSDKHGQRGLIVRDMPDSGFYRRLAPLPAPAAVEPLADEFPNFAPVVEHIAAQLAIARLGDAELRLTPLLLLGDAGVGKTVFASRLAELLGVRSQVLAFSHATQGGTLGGLAAYWSTGRAGEVFNSLLQGGELNPVFVLDELDKAGGEPRHDPVGPLYALLERDSARRFVDEFAEVPINASGFFWIATANEAERIPVPIRSRLMPFAVRSPTSAELREIGRRTYRQMVRDFGLAAHLAPEAPVGLLERVVASPREMRMLIQAAIGRMARAALDGRQLDAPAEFYPAPARPRMGFV